MLLNAIFVLLSVLWLCYPWLREAAGGDAIVQPRPWSDGNAETSSDHRHNDCDHGKWATA